MPVLDSYVTASCLDAHAARAPLCPRLTSSRSWTLKNLSRRASTDTSHGGEAMDKFLKKADVNRAIPARHRKRKRETAGAADGGHDSLGDDSLGDDSLGDDALISACDEAERSAATAGPAASTSSSSSSSHAGAAEGKKQPQQALLGAASVRSSAAQRAAWSEELQRYFLVPFPDDFFDL